MYHKVSIAYKSIVLVMVQFYGICHSIKLTKGVKGTLEDLKNRLGHQRIPETREYF